MGGFEVMQGSLGRYWFPVDSTDRSTWEIAYEGQLVYSVSDGVANLGQASGASDTSGKKIPLGPIVGVNAAAPTYNSTYKGLQITQSDPHSPTAEFRLQGGSGLWPVNDPCAYVLVDVIGPQTVLKGRIFNATYGTAITVGTVSTASTTGAGFTSTACCDVAGIADLSTVYCRSGANRGIYRITSDTSTTVKTVTQYFPFDIAVGDTFVGVPMRPYGPSYVQTDAEATFFNSAATPATNYWHINVLKLDLSEAGNEYVIFTFGADHFTLNRA